MASSLPEVHNDLFGRLGVKGQVVVGTTLSQVLDFVPIGPLVIPSNQAYHCGVICELDYSAGAINRRAVMEYR